MAVTRDQLQREAVEALFARRNVIVNWGTGVGKSRVGVEGLRRARAAGGTRLLLLVVETAHKENWRREFESALGPEEGASLWGALTVECYASLHKYAGTEWDMIVADEAHHLRSDLRTEVISTLKSAYVLCLSATMSCGGDGDAMMQAMRDTFGDFMNLDFGIQDAIDNRILAKPKIYIHLLPLDDLTERQSVTEEWGKKQRRVNLHCTVHDCGKYLDRSRYPAAKVTVTGTARECYDWCTRRAQEKKERYFNLRRSYGLADGAPENRATQWAWNEYVQFCMKRKRILGSAKTVFAEWLLGRLKDKRYVCFCADVEQGRRLGGDHVICADNIQEFGKGYNASVIDAFNNGEIDSIFAVNMIQEGQNLSGIQAGIIIQLSGKERQFIQKFGRAFRASDPEQHLIVIDGTRDVDYYRAAVQGLKNRNEYVRVIPYGSLRRRLV